MPTNDDGAENANAGGSPDGNAGGSNEAHMRAEQLTLWLVEKREDGTILSRPVVVTGQVIFGACFDPLPAEALKRCKPAAEPGDAGTEGAP